MERRKFVIGLGALAAGSGAALGTGAFSQATADGREIEVEVVDDTEGYLGFVIDNDEVQNGQYADLDDEGNLVLSFDDDAGSSTFAPGSGQGINNNSVYLFDGVFGIANQGQDEGFTPQLEFEPGGDDEEISNQAIGIYAQAAGSIDDPEDPDLTEANTASVGGLDPGDANYSASVAIDTRPVDWDEDNGEPKQEIGGTIIVTTGESDWA